MSEDRIKIKKAYKFRLKTTPAIEKKLRIYAGHTRFLWNYFHTLNHKRLAQGQSIMRYYEMDYWSKLLKRSDEYGFLSEAPAHILQQKLKDLERAYLDAFDKQQPNKRMPTRRKRNRHNSFRFPDPKQFEISNRRVSLPKLGWIGFYKSQPIVGVVKNITISYNGGHWYMSIQVEQEVKKPKDRVVNPAGIDMGIAQLATVASTTEAYVYRPKNSYRQLENKLVKAQRKLSRKVKFSKNWQKVRKQLQKIHRKVTHARHDYLHKISTEISKSHAMIYVEDLKVAQMSKSAKGTQEEPGKHVKAKSGLNKSILDQGWSVFKEQLKYKSEWLGGEVKEVPAAYTSQICSSCGHKEKENRQSQSEFKCLSCGLEINADINAAKNILAAGLRRDSLLSELRK